MKKTSTKVCRYPGILMLTMLLFSVYTKCYAQPDSLFAFRGDQYIPSLKHWVDHSIKPDLASILGISADSIKKSRQRLRRRLHLPEEGSLDELVEEV